jgi:RNA polymerase sigma factor (sigma-70 family)
MVNSRMSEVIEHLRRTALLAEGHQLSDAQLLERFVSLRETAALEALVRRHAPMVWGVCQRLLSSSGEAEDAFQATFLVLLRKAASIAKRELLASWLYGVARQTALKARQTAAKRKRRERQVTVMPEPAVPDSEVWRDLGPILDEELSRLPKKYRAAVILCDLEAKSRKEAARELGIPEGTVASRVARARDILARRIARRGLGISGAALGAALANKATACAPPSVITATIKAVTLVGAGQAAKLVSGQAAALVEGVVKAMLVQKLTKMTLIALVLGAIVFAGGLVQYQLATGQQVNALAQKSAAQIGKKSGSQAEVQALQAEVDKLRTELDAALTTIQKMKEVLGQTTPAKEQARLYRGRPLRFWLDQSKDADPKFRSEAMEALGVLAEENKDLIPILVGALKDKSDGVGFIARLALGRLGPDAVPGLLDVLKTKPSAAAVQRAAQAVGIIGPQAKATVPLLAETLKTANWQVRESVIIALRKIGPEAKPEIPAMLNVLGEYVKAVKNFDPNRREETKPDIYKDAKEGLGDRGIGNPDDFPFVLTASLVQINPDLKKLVPLSYLGSEINNWAQRWQQIYDALKKHQGNE